MRKLFLSIIALALSVGARAQETQKVSYLYPVYNIDGDVTGGIKEWQTGSVDATVITEETGTLNAGWYVVTGEVSRGSIYCNGSVHLILADGAKLTAQGGQYQAGITVSGDGNSLTIYGQTAQSGQFSATGGYFGAGIGGGQSNPGSNITINGGTVTATGGDYSAGIGGGQSNPGSNITINGGTVTATGGVSGAGIGGGYHGSGSNITINGGVVTATGGNSGAGIGGGMFGSGSDITINGGVVTATGGDSGAGIGGGHNGGGSSNIKVSADYKVLADNNNPPTTEIAHDSDTDLASSLRVRYAFIEIDQDMLSALRAEAIAAIDEAVEGVANAEIIAIAEEAKNNIMNANGQVAITRIKDAALSELEKLVRIYKSILGPLGTPHTGPAVKVTKGDTEVILYLPDKVEYIIRK